MKSLKILILLILCSSMNLLAQTQEYSWVCLGATPQDTRSLDQLGLPLNLYLPEIKVLIINKTKYCLQRPSGQTLDTCEFARNTLSVRSKISTLRTVKGKTIRLKCQEDEDVGTHGGVGGSN
jgi:hypothetical protein